MYALRVYGDGVDGGATRWCLKEKKYDVFRVGENLLALISFSCFQFSFVSNAHTNVHVTHRHIQTPMGKLLFVGISILSVTTDGCTRSQFVCVAIIIDVECLMDEHELLVFGSNGFFSGAVAMNAGGVENFSYPHAICTFRLYFYSFVLAATAARINMDIKYTK